MSVRLLDVPFVPGVEIDQFAAGLKGVGAVTSFLGLVRDSVTGAAEDAVTGLYLEHHPALTRTGIETVLSEAISKWGLTDAMVIHRIGDMGINDPIVLVCAASEHRRPAFEATDFLMDYLKTEAVFWKKEYRASGASWIEPRAVDYQDAKRWDTERS